MHGAARVGEPDEQVVEGASLNRRDEDRSPAIDVHRLDGPLSRLPPAGQLARLGHCAAAIGEEVPMQPLADEDLDRLAVAVGEAAASP